MQFKRLVRKEDSQVIVVVLKPSSDDVTSDETPTLAPPPKIIQHALDGYKDVFSENSMDSLHNV